MVSPRKLKKFLKAVLSSLLPNNSSSWVYKTQGTSLRAPALPVCSSQPTRAQPVPPPAPGARRRVWPWLCHRSVGLTEPRRPPHCLS